MTKIPRALAALAAAVSISFSAALSAGVIVEANGCLADRATFLGQNCVSNDVTFVLVGLGTQTDGCVAAGSAAGGDEISIFLRAIVRNSTAQTRYDIGMWFASDGDPNGDGALTGECGREMLHPAAAAADFQNADCPPLDLLGSGGPFYVGESSAAAADACADLLDSHSADIDECDEDTDGIYDDSVLDFTDAQTFPCRDTDTNGRLNIPTCASWGNQQDQVFMGACSVTTTQLCQADNQCPGSETCVEFDNTNLCDSENELMNGTAAKCACEDTDTDVPRPDLALSCSCQAPTTVRPGFPVTCTVSYNNPSPTNISPTTNSDLTNRLQAGTAGFVRFVINPGADNGAFSNPTLSDTDGSTTIGSTLIWDPAGGRCDATIGACSDAGDPVAPELNVIGPGESETVTFDYTVDENFVPSPDPQTISLLTQTQWSDTGTGSWVGQPLTATCDITVDTTDALVVDVKASRRSDGAVVLDWETAAETGSVGFEIRRLDADKGYYERVNKTLVPATQHSPGGRYQFVDHGATGVGKLSYQIIEHDVSGYPRTFGPYRFDAIPELARNAGFDKAGGFSAQMKEPSAHTRARFATAKQQRAVKRGPLSEGGRGRVLVTADGLQFIPISVIARTLGLSETATRAFVEKGQVRVSRVTAEVPWKQAVNADGIYFYGHAADGPFSDVNVYWLERGPATRVPHKITELPETGSPSTFFETVHIEHDLLARPAVASDPLSDYWFWKGLIGGHETLGTQEFDFELADVSASLEDARLSIDLFGFNNPDSGLKHRAFLILNGEVLGQLVWEGTGPNRESLAISPTLLREGVNTLMLVAESGAFFVDGFDVGYQRRMIARNDRLEITADTNDVVTVGGFSGRRIQVWDVTDPTAPVFTRTVDIGQNGGAWQVSFQPSWDGAVYEVSAAAHEPDVVPAWPSDLRNRGNAARYLVIAPEKLLAEAGELAELRSDSYSTMVVSLESIMDEFNYGNYSPLAIREFLRYSASEWAVAPEFVVLAGKGSYDYRDLLGQGGNLVPPMMVPTGLSGLVPSDNAFVDFDANGVPDMKLGRLPVLTGEELLAVVAKMAVRENQMLPRADWVKRVLMVADDSDSAGAFSADSTALAGLLPVDALVHEVHLGVTHELSAARNAVASKLGQGVGLMNFVGHGGFDRITGEGLLKSSDVPALGDSQNQPFVTALTCNIGLHAFPGFVSLGEILVVSPNNGAVAVFSPTGQNLNAPSVGLGSYLFSNWMVPGIPTVGDVTVESMRDYMNAGGNAESLASYSILGDPASPVMPQAMEQ